MYENLKRIRSIMQDIKIEDILKALGLKTKGAYYKKETGANKFSLNDAKNLSNLFNMPIEEIFFDNEISKTERNAS